MLNVYVLVRWFWYMDVFYLTSFVCRPPKKFPTVGTSDSCPMWLTLMTMFPINQTSLARHQQLQLWVPCLLAACCVADGFHERKRWNKFGKEFPPFNLTWDLNSIYVVGFFFPELWEWWLYGRYHPFSSARQSWLTLHGEAMGPLSPLHFAARCRTTKHVEVQDDPCEATKIWQGRNSMHQWFCKKRKCWNRESKNLEKSRGFNENDMLPVCTKAEYYHRHTEMTKSLLYLYVYIYYNHIIPITLSYLICRHCWHMIHAYQQQNRYLASPWTSGRQSYGAMLPALWKNWTWPSSSWETWGQPAGEPAGNRKGVENVFWGLKSYRLMCLGWCFCDWRFQHVFFSGFHEDNVDWSGWVSRFLAVLPCLNGWEVVCYKHSWGQVQRPKKTCWPFWVSIQVPRSPWRSIF